MKFSYSCSIGLLLAVSSISAWADLDIAQGPNGKLQIVAQEVANGTILESLSRELDFKLTIDNAEWAKQKRSLDRTGNVDALLKILLGSTNHLVSYDGDGISSVAVLTAGSSGPGVVASSPISTPLARASVDDLQQRPATTPITAETLGGQPTPVDAVAIADATAENLEADAADATSEDAQVPAPTNINNLLRKHASASLTEPATESGARPAASMQAPLDPQAANPELARMTRQAQQDVQAMAEMLRQAEAQLQPASQ